MERLCVTSIEQELRFCEWLKRNNIKKILLDLDETVSVANIYFDERFLECEQIAIQESVDKTAYREKFKQLNNDYYETYAVNPDRWPALVGELKRTFGFSDHAQEEMIGILQQIYATPVEFKDGMENALKFLHKTGTDFGIVTHANKLWTWRKYNWLGLNRFIGWDDIYIVDENSHKTAESWLNAARYFNIKPDVCMVVGDSPRTDMCAGEVGFRHLYLVGSEEKLWSIHNADMPKGVRRIDSASDIIHLGCCKY